MLNYIWLFLISLGILSALLIDIKDSTDDKYRNGQSFKTEIFIDNTELLDETTEVPLKIEKERFNEFYSEKISYDIDVLIQLIPSDNKRSGKFILKAIEKLPPIWGAMASANGEKNELTGTWLIEKNPTNRKANINLSFDDVSFLKTKGVTKALFDYAEIAVNIALGLIGIMALWLGIMKIAESAGLINLIAKSVKPITKIIFPEVPSDHPAIGAMMMNISANMLGLGNAATPFGIKAMEELDKLNPEKGTATNAMCTFLAINTAGLTLIPATAIAIRASAGSSNPAIIIGTSFFGALCATITGIVAAKILEKFTGEKLSIKEFIVNNKRLVISSSFAILLLLTFGFSGLLTSIVNSIDFNSNGIFKTAIEFISVITIPIVVLVFVIYGIIKKVKIYEEFVEGAKEGFQVAIKIIPYLVAMLVAIGIFRAGGALEFTIELINPITSLIGFPAEVLPMALMRPLSGSGSLGIMTEIMSVHGADSFIGVLASTIMGSTETTLYVLAVYFGAVNIKRIRHAAAAGLLADVAGILAALFIVKMLF
ncbi:MAG: spore maturation protein [Melioribacteraceae bacterium]|nr:spore maturation protein [Melioribacteraceae bacterium]MCF8263626.1 spore maturation protein [Melioribacteraceae bacterium]MCF8431337.1 spore maturation protein [Melioribacteraceae bacterium]